MNECTFCESIGCLTCSKDGFDCLTCHENFVFDAEEQSCNCPDAFTLDEDFQCQACPTGCSTCIGRGINDCKTCENSFFESDFDELTETLSCFECTIEHCSKCQDIFICEVCEAGYQLVPNGSICFIKEESDSND